MRARESVLLYMPLVSIPTDSVTKILDASIAEWSTPSSLKTDNGMEFTSRHYDVRAWSQGITLDFTRPGRPIESFNARLRDERLNQSWFLSSALAAWGKDYNASRPHGSLGGLAPSEFVANILECGEGLRLSTGRDSLAARGLERGSRSAIVRGHDHSHE